LRWISTWFDASVWYFLWTTSAHWCNCIILISMTSVTRQFHLTSLYKSHMWLFACWKRLNNSYSWSFFQSLRKLGTTEDITKEYNKRTQDKYGIKIEWSLCRIVTHTSTPSILSAVVIKWKSLPLNSVFTIFHFWLFYC
jgi:hypothetical protein